MAKLKRFKVKTDMENCTDAKFSGYRAAINYFSQLVFCACDRRSGTVTLEFEYVPGSYEITHYFVYKKDYELV